MPKSLELRAHRLMFHPDNPRGNNCLSDEELKSSIRQNGILSPLLVWQSDWTKSVWIVIDGHRRLQAARELGLARVPVMAYEPEEMDSKRANFLLLESNIKTKSLSPEQEAKALALRIEKFGLTQAEVAVEYGKSASWVSQKLSLLAPKDRPAKKDGRGRPRNPESPALFTPVNKNQDGDDAGQSVQECSSSTPETHEAKDEEKAAPAAKVEAPASPQRQYSPKKFVSDSHLRYIRSAPEDAQEVLLEVVELRRLNQSETSDLAKALREAPEESLASIVDTVRNASNPVSFVQYQVRLAREKRLRDAKREGNPMIYEGSPTEKLFKAIKALSNKISSIESKERYGEEPKVKHTVKWFIAPDYLLECAHCDIVNIIKHLRHHKAELEKLLAQRADPRPRTRASVTHLHPVRDREESATDV